VLLGVTGGVAAYKSIELARRLAQAGALVDTVLTPAACDFVTPLAFEAVTGRAPYLARWAPGDALRHIRLAREVEAVVVAPATADFLARAAAGRADDLLGAVLLATRVPALLCPAMNDRMFEHPATQANLERVRALGYQVLGPSIGPLAWGEGEGPGRMVEPEEIVAHLARVLERPSLAGRRVLVTAGPTREAIDPVRFVSNRSSGRMGYALAEVAWRRGAAVTLVSGPTALPPPVGVELVRVETAAAMAEAVAAHLPAADVLVMAAAPADFRPAAPAAAKLTKEDGLPPPLAWALTADILQSTRPLRRPDTRVVGFALETADDALARARAKLEAKGLDLVVLNRADEADSGFDTETNRVTVIDAAGRVDRWPLLPKAEVAERLWDRIEELLP